MIIRVVGCGNAFSYKNYNQSFLLEENGQKLLIDCGTRVPTALHDQGIDIKSITDVYISHCHGDHIGGLEELAFLRYNWGPNPRTYKDIKTDRGQILPPNLYANKLLMQELWEHSLSGGLKSMEGFDAQLDTFFVPKPIEPNQTFTWQGWTCSLVQQIHVMTGSVMMNTFGLFMERITPNSNGINKIFFTTDAQYFQPEQVKIFYDNADIVFQDCECIGCNTKDKKLLYKSGVHANYAQLAGWESVNAYKLPAETKCKLYLSHYQDFVTEGKDNFGNVCDWDKMAIEDGFKGFVYVGMTVEV